MKTSSYLSDEDLAIERAYAAKRRREGKTPAGVRRRNRAKRHGNLRFSFDEAGLVVSVRTVTKNPAAELILRTLSRAIGGKLFKVGHLKGAFLLEFNMKDPAAVLAAIGCKPVPASCARCNGEGKIQKPDSKCVEHVSCPACHGSGMPVPADEDP